VPCPYKSTGSDCKLAALQHYARAACLWHRLRHPPFGMRMGAEGGPPPSLPLPLSTPCRARRVFLAPAAHPLIWHVHGRRGRPAAIATATAEHPLLRAPRVFGTGHAPPYLACAWAQRAARRRTAIVCFIYATLHMLALLLLRPSLRKYSHEPGLGSLRLCRGKSQYIKFAAASRRNGRSGRPGPGAAAFRGQETRLPSTRGARGGGLPYAPPAARGGPPSAARARAPAGRRRPGAAPRARPGGGARSTTIFDYDNLGWARGPEDSPRRRPRRGGTIGAC
jgi:hypothetical protein